MKISCERERIRQVWSKKKLFEKKKLDFVQCSAVTSLVLEQYGLSIAFDGSLKRPEALPSLRVTQKQCNK